jgi:general secretion pathway protein G
MRGRKKNAFTLIEIMTVIVILGILAGFVMPKIMSRPEDARRTKARMQIKSLEAALSLYKLDTGNYPSTSQGLSALIQAPSGVRGWRDEGYIEQDKVPIDPWGNQFVYLSPGVKNKNFDIVSYGKDGLNGGEGYDADIFNGQEG